MTISRLTRIVVNDHDIIVTFAHLFLHLLKCTSRKQQHLCSTEAILTVQSKKTNKLGQFKTNKLGQFKLIAYFSANLRVILDCNKTKYIDINHVKIFQPKINVQNISLQIWLCTIPDTVIEIKD